MTSKERKRWNANCGHHCNLQKIRSRRSKRKRKSSDKTFSNLLKKDVFTNPKVNTCQVSFFTFNSIFVTYLILTFNLRIREKKTILRPINNHSLFPFSIVSIIPAHCSNSPTIACDKNVETIFFPQSMTANGLVNALNQWLCREIALQKPPLHCAIVPERIHSNVTVVPQRNWQNMRREITNRISGTRVHR